MAAAIGAIGGIAGGLIQSSSANKAVKAQQQAAREQLALQREMFDYSKEIQEPFFNRGNTAGDILAYELWGGAAPTIGGTGFEVGGTTYGTREEAENALAAARTSFDNASTTRNPGEEEYWQTLWQNYERSGGNVRPPNPEDMNFGAGGDINAGIAAAGFDPRTATINEVGGTEYGGFTKTPDYQFAYSEGRNAVDSSAAAAGGLKSGATLKALTEYGQNYAGLRRDNYINQLFGMQGSAQNSANAMQSAGNAYATGGSNAWANFGNAGAAGAIAKGNALSSGINAGLQGIGSIADQLFGGGVGIGGTNNWTGLG